MTALFVIIAALGTAALNLFFAKKISKKEYRPFIKVANVMLAVLLAALFVVAGGANKRLQVFLGEQISRAGTTVNKIYPGAFEKSFSTVEAKVMLKSCLDTFESSGSAIETVAVNIVKLKFDKYISLALSAITALEKTEGTISLKDALSSLEYLLLERTAAFFKMARLSLFVIYIVYFIVMLLVSLHLADGGRKENKSIVFGEEQ